MVTAVLGCVFGVLGIFTFGIIFVPLAGLCTLFAIRQSVITKSGQTFFVSFLSGILTVIGFIVSPSLWVVVAGMMTTAHQSNIPKPPDAFAWHMGEQPPPGVTPNKNGMPEGYEMQSGVNHGCPLPECMWFVRMKPGNDSP